VKDFIPSGLTNLLKSEKPETRKFAAYALGRIGDRRALPALARVADNPEEPKLVREVAGRAMQRLNPEKAEGMVDPDSFVEAEDPPLQLRRFRNRTLFGGHREVLRFTGGDRAPLGVQTVGEPVQLH